MIVFRYLTREVYAPMLATTAVLLLILICNQFIHYLGDTASGGLTVRALMLIMSLQIPLLLGFMLPLGLFLGILLAYGRLYVDNEMTVLFACGLSRAKLLGITMGFSCVVMVVVGVLMLWVEPKMAWYRDHAMDQAAAASPLEKIFPGRFETLMGGRMVLYAERLSRDKKRMENVFVAVAPKREDAGQPWNVVAAGEAKEVRDPKTHQQFLEFSNGYRYIGAPGKKQFQMMQYDKYGVHIPAPDFVMGNDVDSLPTLALWKKSKHSNEAAAELQWRFALPISVLLLAMVAVPLSRVQPRRGRYAQLIPAMLIYIVYADLMFVAQAWIQNGKISAALGMWWVHGFLLLVGLLLLGRYFGWRQILRTLLRKKDQRQQKRLPE